PWSPHSQPALTTTATPLARCHAPALIAPTLWPAVAPRSQPPHLPKAAESSEHGSAACSAFQHRKPDPPAHSPAWDWALPASAPPGRHYLQSMLHTCQERPWGKQVGACHCQVNGER